MADEQAEKVDGKSTRKRHKTRRQPLCANNSYSCHKLWLFNYILFYLLSGLVLLTIGIFSEIERQKYTGLDSWLALPVAMLIFVGLVVSINGLCGCVGVTEEKINLIKLFFGVSIVTFIAQIVLAVVVFCYGRDLSGLLLLTLGIFIEIERRKYTGLAPWLALPVAMLIFVSLVISIHVLCGCVGETEEKVNLLKLTANVRSSDLALKVFSKQYSRDQSLQNDINRIQAEFSCCGIESWHDYVDILNVCRERCIDTSQGRQCEFRCIFPQSCCSLPNSHVLPESCISRRSVEAPPTMTTKPGCYHTFFDWLRKRMDLIGATTFGLALPQVAGLIWTFLVLRKIKEYQTLYTVDLPAEYREMM